MQGFLGEGGGGEDLRQVFTPSPVKPGLVICKEVRYYSLLCLLILIQAFIRKCTPALAVDPIFRWVGVEALIGGGAGVGVTRGVSWMR